MKDNPESRGYAFDSAEAFRKGGWDVIENPEALYVPSRYGLFIRARSQALLPADAALLKASLEEAGVKVDAFDDPLVTPPSWEIVVGYRPSELMIPKKKRSETADRPDFGLPRQ